MLAMLSLLLSAVGTYGTAAYGVTQRTHEMGVRMALGATYGSVRTLMLSEVFRPIAGGALMGIAGALVTGRYLDHLIPSARTIDIGTLVTAMAVLLCVGLLASWNATGRVLAINPAEAVRAD